MYLSDRDIKALLPEIAFDTEDPGHPFLADEQIQPCSVDLRLDSVFWRQVSRKPIDLRRAKLLEVSPRRHWKRLDLRPGESVSLRAGEMILGRTFEIFTIPTTHAGKLEGRSSFARMGLAVHCSADFINPGYRGRMPLELVNLGKSTIRLFPKVPICQVMFIPLSSRPERAYGERELSSKYMNDDGGPSYWWRDKRVRQLQQALGEHDVAEAVQNQILELIAPSDPELIERFERYVERMRREEFTNAHDVLERFSVREDRIRLWAQLKNGVQVGLGPLMIATSLGSLFAPPVGLIHYLIWGITVLAIPLTIRGIRSGLGDFFGKRELAATLAAAGTHHPPVVPAPVVGKDDLSNREDR